MNAMTPIQQHYPTHAPIPAPPEGQPIHYRCQCCGGDSLQVEAVAMWDSRTQRWTIRWTSPAMCNDCDSPTTAVRRDAFSGAPVTRDDRFLAE